MALNPLVEQIGWDEENIKELTNTGYALLKEGKYQMASLFFETLVRLDPENSYHYQTLGSLYLECNENEQCIKVLDQGLKIEPTHQPSLLNKAKALLIMEKREEGLEIAQKLMSSPDKRIANVAEALVLSYK